MWKIFNAEIRYHKLVLTIAYTMSVQFVIAATLSGMTKSMDSPQLSSFSVGIL